MVPYIHQKYKQIMFAHNLYDMANFHNILVPFFLIMVIQSMESLGNHDVLYDIQYQEQRNQPNQYNHMFPFYQQIHNVLLLSEQQKDEHQINKDQYLNPKQVESKSQYRAYTPRYWIIKQSTKKTETMLIISQAFGISGLTMIGLNPQNKGRQATNKNFIIGPLIYFNSNLDGRSGSSVSKFKKV
ncbi:unnamed protein product [Paramecium sonneborni]|uniref:Transmembrane protein n=1 Tax=Paramecium sonneborni TaxID=65129 RepID=A0A8S1PK48_9CILI|nr:unnamed protein product [Paramecium sonneborni]